jgi:hypothetical protein
VGFGRADAQGAEEKKRVMPNDLRKVKREDIDDAALPVE